MATTISTSANGRDLEIEREMIEVSINLPQPDPNWTYTDRAGHDHAYSAQGSRYPTLVRRESDPYWCADCDDEHTDSWWECPLCGEKITPGTFIDSSRKFIPGLTMYRINGEDVSPAEGEALLAEIEAKRQEAARRRASQEAQEKARLTAEAMRSEGFTEDQIESVIQRMSQIQQP